MILYYFALLLSSVTCALSLVGLIKKVGLFFVIMLTPCLGLVSQAVAAAVLDQGVYVSELGLITWNTFAAPAFFSLLTMFFVFVRLFVPMKVDASSNETREFSGPSRECGFRRGLPTVGVLLAGYLSLDMIATEVPILSGGAVTRFNYWTQYSVMPGAELVSNLLTVVSVGLGFLNASSALVRRDAKRNVAIVALFIILRFALGYKVSGVVDIVVGFAAGYVFRRYSIERMPTKSFRTSIHIIVAVCLFSILSFMSWQLLSGSVATVGGAWHALVDRQFSLSSHLWWSVMSDSSRSHSFLPHDLSELASVYRGESELSTDTGVYGLMNVYAPSSVHTSYVDNGVRFAAPFFTVSLFYNGWLITLLFVVLNAAIMGLFFRLFRRDATAGRVLSFALLYRVYVVFLSYLTASGTLVSFYRPNMLVLALVYVCVRFLENEMILRSGPTKASGYGLRLLPFA